MSFDTADVISVMQAAVTVLYIFSLFEMKRAALKYLLCVLSGGALAAGVYLCDRLWLTDGIGCVFYPVLMLVFSVSATKGGLLLRLLASVVPLSAGIGADLWYISAVRFSPHSSLKQKLTQYPELISSSVSVLIMCFVLFGISVRIIRNRKLIGRYEKRMLSALLILSAAAVLILLCFAVIREQNFGMESYLDITALLLSGLCLLIARMSEIQSRQTALENDLEFSKLREHYQQQYIDSLMQQYGTVRRIKHDMKGSFLTLTGLLRAGEYDKAYSFAKENTDALEAMQTFVDTDNAAANAVINSKLSYAAELGISTKCISVNSIKGISDSDLCSLLGNALDNAVEACTALPADIPREISLEIGCENERFYTFLIKNTVAGSVLENDPDLATTKPDKDSHGLGIKIIRSIAAKYGGRVDHYEEDGLFCCRIAVIAVHDKK